MKVQETKERKGLLSTIGYVGMFCASLGACTEGCPITEEKYATITNSFESDVTVEFRYRRTDVSGSSEEYIYFEETIPAKTTEQVFIQTVELDGSAKFGQIEAFCEDEEQISRFESVSFSNDTLSQYTICLRQSEKEKGYQILEMGSRCEHPNGFQETDGW